MLSHLVAVSRNGIYSTCGYGQRTVGLHQHLRLSNERTELLVWDGDYDPELSYIPPPKGCQGSKTLSYPHELNGEPSRSNWTVRVRVRWRPQRFPRPPCLTFDPKAKPVTTPTRELYLPKTEDYHCTHKTVPIGKEAHFGAVTRIPPYLFLLEIVYLCATQDTLGFFSGSDLAFPPL